MSSYAAPAVAGRAAAFPGDVSPEASAASRSPHSAAPPALTHQGQIVIVVARWILVLAGLMLAIWNPAPVGELRLQLLVLLGLAVANFFLHAQLLMRRPVQDAVVYAASAADLAVITTLILSQHGFASDLYIFYFVALLAFSITFPTRETAIFAGVTGAIYTAIGLVSLDTSAARWYGTPDDNLLALVARVLMLAAAAFCGNLYWRQERERRLSPVVEAAADLFFGQSAIIWARWFIILAGAIVVLWSAASPGEMAAKMLLVVALMAMNFFLHGRYLLEKPANVRVVLAASALDLALVTAMVCTWQAGVGGLHSPLFVFYYPALLAFAFVFRPRLALAYTAAALVAYVGACLLVDPSFVLNASDLKVLAARLITLVAMGGLGAYYWRILRGRRRTQVTAVA
jgi:hypothetical protein